MFKIGQEYRRASEIHALYGGQAQGGISTPAGKPYVFIFTSPSGESYGYDDQFVDGLFHYTGEGRTGDMSLDRSNNRAILKHADDGKELHIFEQTRKAYVRYMGQGKCVGYHTGMRKDSNQDLRQALIFHIDLDSQGASSVEVEQVNFNDSLEKLKRRKLTLAELRHLALAKPETLSSQRIVETSVYIRSEAIKRYVLARSDGYCESCRELAPFKTSKGPYLECHHIHRLADGGPDAPENVIGLCPNCHRKAHFSSDRVAFNQQLSEVAQRIEQSNAFVKK